MLLYTKNRQGNSYDQKFKGQKRLCHISGFTGYEKEMVKINGKWILKKFVDEDEINDLSNVRPWR